MRRLVGRGAQKIVAGGQQRNERQRAQEDIESVYIGLERLARDHEGEQFKDRAEVVGKQGAREFDADYHEQDTVHQVVKGLRTAPVHAQQFAYARKAIGNDSRNNRNGQKALQPFGG